MSAPARRAAVLAWLLAALAAGCARTAPPVFDLREATIADLQARMEAGKDTARSLAEKYLARIAAIDRQGPALHSLLEVNPDALAIADRRDAERRAGKLRGPLHGIPILVKDNIDTADRMQTTAGSLALEGNVAARDAFVIARLREAGAVILGKTNLSEWANFRSTHATSGWSGRGGLTRNPYALDRNPSGSSSGSAVAVAADLCAAALGTETDGSIVSPASVNGIVGIKPTLGLVSRTGIIPIAHSQDTAGPMARTVTDAAIVLSVLAAADPADPITRNPVTIGPLDYTRFLVPTGLQGARIGVVRQVVSGDAAVAAAYRAALTDLARLGAVLVDPVVIPHLDEYHDTEDEVLLYEFKTDVNRYLSSLGPLVPARSLEAVIAFNERERARSMPHFGQELLLAAQEKGPLSEARYLDALKRNRRLARKEGLDVVFETNRLDAIVAPTGGRAWLTDLKTGDRPDAMAGTAAAVAGYPHVTVPMGLADRLPVGLSFIGPAWSEPALVRMAYAYEQGTSRRQPPTFLPTVSAR